jgi:hypothetical protein
MNMSVWNPFREMEDMLDRYTRATGRGLRPCNSIYIAATTLVKTKNQLSSLIRTVNTSQ